MLKTRQPVDRILRCFWLVEKAIRRPSSVVSPEGHQGPLEIASERGEWVEYNQLQFINIQPNRLRWVLYGAVERRCSLLNHPS